jgi:hypothetical protein
MLCVSNIPLKNNADKSGKGHGVTCKKILKRDGVYKPVTRFESPCIYMAKGGHFTWRKQCRQHLLRYQESGISPEADVESTVNIAA